MVEFEIRKKANPNTRKYKREDIDLAYEFTKKLYKEFGSFLKAVVLFGSSARKEQKSNDIDMLVIADDTSIYLNQEVVEAFRVITERLIVETSTRIHVTSLRFTSFWDYIRVGDPIGINMLRDGIALIDSGFFDPLQVLLYQGRIRPTFESIWTYSERAPMTLDNSKWHILQATIDLYWATIDAAHAALMSLGEVPPTPAHVADLMEEKMVKKKLIDAKYATMMRNFYKLAKMITHREIKEISGTEFDSYRKDAADFIEKMRSFIKEK